MTTSPAHVPAASTSSTGRPRVVIIGSGFGGLFAAQALRRLGPRGLAALREVVDREKRLAGESGAGAHARSSAAHAHALEALALATVSGAAPSGGLVAV